MVYKSHGVPLGIYDAGTSTTNIDNSINAYKVELPDDYNILPTFNVKDFRLYHGE